MVGSKGSDGSHRIARRTDLTESDVRHLATQRSSELGDCAQPCCAVCAYRGRRAACTRRGLRHLTAFSIPNYAIAPCS